MTALLKRCSLVRISLFILLALAVLVLGRPIQRASEMISKLVGAVGMMGGTDSFVAAMKRDDFTS